MWREVYCRNGQRAGRTTRSPFDATEIDLERRRRRDGWPLRLARNLPSVRVLSRRGSLSHETTPTTNERDEPCVFVLTMRELGRDVLRTQRQVLRTEAPSIYRMSCACSVQRAGCSVSLSLSTRDADDERAFYLTGSALNVWHAEGVRGFYHGLGTTIIVC